MPNYNAQNPPYAVFPGDLVTPFNDETPTAGQAGQQFALADYSGDPDQGRTVRWQTLFATSPTAVSIALQGALQDVDAEYFTLDTSTNVAGESRSVSSVRAKFLRAKLTSITGGSGLTVLLTT
jgi:hypothetical protein